MARISGIEIPKEKRIDIALTYVYGIGRGNVGAILKAANIEPGIRTNTLTDDDINKIQKIIDTYKVEGDLKREIYDNIKRLKEIGSYRGTRHSKNLPARGQNTRRNARTKRGKRVTIGAIKKEITQTTAVSQGENKTPEKNKEK